MIVENDSFSQKFHCAILNNNTPCSFWLNGEEAHIDWSDPVNIFQNDFYKCYERYAQLEGGLTAKISYRAYERAIIFGVTLQQTGEESSGLIEQIEFARIISDAKKPNVPEVQYPRLLYNRGSDATTMDWHPLDVELWPVNSITLSATHGRGSDQYIPYFNLDLGDGTGFFMAIGYSGHWSVNHLFYPKQVTSRFYYPGAAFRLKEGESVELPQMLVLPWTTDHYTRDLADTFNLFRRFMKEFIMPKPGGKEFNMPVTMRAWGNTDLKGHDIRIGNIKKYDLRAASYGIDAGWYELNGSGTTHDD